MKKSILILVILIFIIIAANAIIFTYPIYNIALEDSRNEGILAIAYLRFGIFFPYIVFDLWKVENKSNADIQRVFQLFAEYLKNFNFQRVYLSHHGKLKFYVDGNYFKNLGEQTYQGKYMFGTVTIADNLKSLSGYNFFMKSDSTGIFEELNSIKNFNEMHRFWWHEWSE